MPSKIRDIFRCLWGEIRRHPRFSGNLICLLVLILVHLIYGQAAERRGQEARAKWGEVYAPVSSSLAAKNRKIDEENIYWRAFLYVGNDPNRRKVFLGLMRQARLEDHSAGGLQWAVLGEMLDPLLDETAQNIGTNHSEAGELLLDAWHLYRLIYLDADRINGAYFNQNCIAHVDASRLFDLTRQIGISLKREDPARPAIESLIRVILDDSHTQSARLLFTQERLEKLDVVGREFGLLTSKIDSLYADHVRRELGELDRISNGQFDLLRLKEFDFASMRMIPTRPLQNRVHVEFPGSLKYPLPDHMSFREYERFLEKDLIASHKAALGLACRLYQLDHDAFPERLEQLIPRYIPEIPGLSFTPGETPSVVDILKQ